MAGKQTKHTDASRTIALTARYRAATLTLFCFLACALPVAAHPLGNFTINHLTKLTPAGRQMQVRYVLDLAEIPAFQAMRAEDASGRMSRSELNVWARREGRELLGQLRLDAGSAALPLAFDRAQAMTRPGAGGLPTLYLTLEAHAALPAASGAQSVRYHDGTFAGRLGWKDVVVAPATEPTNELRAYPSALLGSPRDITALAMRLEPGGAVTVTNEADAPAQAASEPSAVRSNQLSDMLARGTRDPGFVVLTFLVAILLGALHALEPGHGKTLLAVSLVGARATVKQAAILAAALTLAHTAGVLALGLAINLFKGAFVPESIYPWITLVSGIVVALVGARAVERQVALRRPYAHVHTHAHPAAHPHVHEHRHAPLADAHDHHTHERDQLEHAKLHAIPGEGALRFGPAVWAAMSGGVAPCPAALVVLLAAVALDQVLYGVFVIVAFSFGLAATLTGLGIAVVRGASWLKGRPQFERFVTCSPLVSAVVIAAIGAVMVGQGFAAQGTPVSPLAVTALTALAIVGYVFSHPFAQRRPEAA
jgi:nickel/cobalt exporter